ncbi:hypothetical protein, partial [Escherichia coli]|uniref:hypothetical protein n=1 Tax=Escherichia coli TaxID=562 RepID=UPI001BDBB036
RKQEREAKDGLNETVTLIAPVVAVIQQQGMWYYRGGCLSLSGSGKTQVPEMRRPHLLIH